MEHSKGKVEVREGLSGYVIAETAENGLNNIVETPNRTALRKANAERIAALFNAADGLSTEQAVRLIEHGPEMLLLLNRYYNGQSSRDEYIESLLAKMEGK